MNDIQEERMKWALIGALIGVVVGLLIGGRYDVKPTADTGIAWRVDHWAGKATVIGPTGQPINAPYLPEPRRGEVQVEHEVIRKAF